MKTVLVTGAAGNLGQAVVQKFLSGGVSVVGTVLGTDPPVADHPALEKVVVDLADEMDSKQFVESAITKYGNIDAAVLTVGGFAAGNIADTKTADIMKQYKLNFETAYNIARPVFMQMVKQKGGQNLFNWFTSRALMQKAEKE